MLDLWVRMNPVMISVGETKKNKGRKTMAKCAVCACEVGDEELEHIEVKGKVKKVCQECVTAIKGLA
jgi:hypothetical protein